MTRRRERNRQRFRAITAARFVAAIALGIAGLTGPCGAAELLPPARDGGVTRMLASVTVLSEAAMAKEAATGVAPAQIIGDQTGRGKVMLWDEMRAPPEMPPGTNGSVTLTTGGGGK